MNSRIQGYVKSSLLTTAVTGSQAANITRYLNFITGVSTSEDARRQYFPFPCVIRNLNVYIGTFTLDVSVAWTVNKNGSSTSLTVTNSASGVQRDTSNIVSVDENDYITIVMDSTASASGSFADIIISAELVS